MTGISGEDKREQMEKGSEGKKVMGGLESGREGDESWINLCFWKVTFE